MASDMRSLWRLRSERVSHRNRTHVHWPLELNSGRVRAESKTFGTEEHPERKKVGPADVQEYEMEMALGMATLSSKGQIILPKAARKAAHLEQGDPFKVEMTDEGDIVLRRQKVVDARGVLNDAERDRFLELLDRPPSVKPHLRSLFERGSVLPQE
jgi:AbrB family looped-hinge helix DNA binding protein